MEQIPPARARERVATFARRREAEAAVAALAAQGMPLDRVSVVARDFSAVELEPRTRSLLHSVLAGGGFGALVGSLCGLVFGVVVSAVSAGVFGVGLFAWGLAIGAVIGCAHGAIGYARGRGKPPRVRRIRAGAYDVMVEAGCSETARRALRRG